MKLAKKTLSVFLSLLMIFSVCSVGLTGITASAAAGDSKYTHAEVVAALNEVVAQGYSAKGSGNATNITGDNGKLLAAAEAVFDYAVKTYRGGRADNSANNSSDTLYNAFINEFSADFSNATALNTVKAFAKDIIYPAGTAVYGYENRKTGSYTYTDSNTGYWEDCDYLADKGTDVTEYSEVQNSYNTSVVKTTINKSVDITVDIDKYLQTFTVIEDIPSSFLTSVSYDYSHAYGRYAEVTNTSLKKTSASWGRTKYTKTTNVTTWAWNYMSAKPVRVVEKNTTAKKFLLSIEKYFNEDIFALTQADLLAMSVSEIEKLYTESQGFYTMAKENFSAATLAHFGMSLDKIEAFMTMLDFAYRVIIGKHSIDTLNQYIGTEYNKETYAEMSSLYTKVNKAYNIVDTMDTEILDFILDEYEYSDEYSAIDLTESKAYIDELYDIMTEQRLEELVASMTATYNDYYSLLDKENIEVPTDAEIIGLVQKVDAYNSVLAQYPGYDYYRTYYTTEHEAAWNDFCAKLSEVAEVRDLKATFQTYYDFFMPIIFTTMIVDLSNDAAIDLYENIETNLTNLKNNYTDIKNQWGETIANKIFTINYEGTDYLLQDLIKSVKSTGLEALKQNLIDRTIAQLDAVMVFKDVTVVNFDNFADVKSTISHFDYELYDYVNGKGWLDSTQTSKYAMVQTLLDRYHAFSTTDGKAFFDEDFTFADENGNYAIRYAGDQVDANGKQIGYPSDIARGGAEDNFVVDEQIMVDTIVRIDNFIVSRDFGALVGFVDVETEEPTDLKTFVSQMLSDMLYTDELINTLVAAIFPMICDLIETELVGAIGGMDGAWVDDNGIPWLDLYALAGIGGNLALYLDNSYAPSHDGGNQKDFPTVFKELGLYIYPSTLAESLSVSNPSYYGKDSEIYKALTAAGRDWSKLVAEDDPDTLDVDETKILEFAWGVYDEDSFLDTIACILDSILPILQAVFTNGGFSEEVSNAAIAYSPELLSVDDVFIRGGLRLTIDPLNAYSTLIVPLFEVLGVEKIPALNAGCSCDDITRAVFGTLLDRVDEILDAPLSNILDILPNLVYFLSMDSVQEIIDGLNIKLNLNIHEVEVIDFSGILGYLLDGLDGILAEKISFDIELKIADLLDLYDLLGFEITNFNEVLEYLLPTLGLDIKLPPVKQQEIIFCSDWGYNAAGRVDLESNKGDLLYWLLDYIISAIADGTLIDALLAGSSSDEGDATPGLGEGLASGVEIDLGDPMLNSLIDKIVNTVAQNQDGALAAIVELLNPVTYDLEDMNWLESTWNYNGIEGANQMSIVYLNYDNNDWTRDKAEYLVNNINPLLDAILEMTGTEMEDLGVLLQDTVNGLFTNENVTALVKMLGGLGDSASAVITDVVKNQVGINLDSWFIAFGYLFPAETWKEDAEIIEPSSRNYVNNFGVEGVANEDGTISWFFNRMPLVDGDGYTFINILSRLLGEASILVEFLFAGEDISAFETLVTVKGYETYDTSLGLLLEMLGVQNIPTQADFNADAMGSFTNMLMSLLDWFYALTSSDDMIAQLLELIPDLFYFIESNGLSTLLHNLLMPILVLVDTIRPIFDVDVNGLLSYIVSDFLNYGALDTDGLLQFLVDGINVHFSDLDYVWYSVDINNLKVSEIIKILDTYMGTNLYESGLVQVGVKGYCSGIEKVENTAVGTVYKSTVDAPDAVTILVTALLDCLSYPTADGSTNGDVLFAFIAEKTGNEKIADLYPAIASVIAGIDVEYTEPDWGYMFESADLFTLDLPTPSIVYLGYHTDWTPEVADSVYGVLDEVLDLVLPEVLDEGETIATLINGLLEDNVYSDAVLTDLVELIVNAIAGLDSTLRDVIDVVIDTDIATWFKMCKETVDEEGNTVYVCTKDWRIDAAADADKKDLFIAGLKEVLTPANSLLAWLFFGDEYAFFTGSETDAEGNYVYNDIIKLNGGEGYAYGLVPIFEALGCEMAPASAYYDAATKTYNTADAVEGILDSVFALVDKISANPVEEVFKLLPNIIYFVNADGLVSSVNNLLAPVDGLIEKLSPIISEDGSKVSIGGLLEDMVDFNISNITTETLLQIAVDNGITFSPEMLEIICNLYVGDLVEFTSANGNKAYRLDVSEAEGDVLTIVLCLALDLFKLNKETFAPLMGEDIYDAVITLIAGAVADFSYIDPNWAYMYEGEDALAQLLANNLPARTQENSIVYTQYTNNWNKATADYLDSILFDLVKGITESARDDGKTVGILLDDAITNGLYQDDILDSLIEAVVGLMLDYEEIIKGAGALLGAESIADWFSYCEITVDENGETVVTCTKDWLIDAAPTNAAKRTAFVEAFVTALEPAYRLLGWLLFGEEYEFFDGTTSEVLITIKGGNGYAEGLVPLLEALGCTMGADTDSGIKTPEAFYVDGELDMEQAVRDVFTALTDVLAEICGDMNTGSIDVMLEKLPNIIYFINAGGLKAVVNNLLQPVNFILEALEPMGVSVDFSTLVKQIDITNVDFYAIFGLVEDLVELYFPADVQKFVAEFYMGEVVPFTSANGKQAFRMQYTDAESRADMITILISLVLDAAQDPRNEGKLSDWLGEDIYWSIMNVLRIEKCKDMEDYNWILTEYANTGKQFSAIETSTRYSVYNEYWTKDKAQYMADNFNPLVSNVLCLLGLEINGTVTHDIYDLLDVVISDNLYTQEMADTILNAIKDLLANLTELEPYGEYIVDVLNTAFGIDLSVYDTMTVTITEGTREEFEAALVQMLTPVVPLLEVILCGENISLFYELDGDETIVIFGSEGYAYGIIPILEALGCTMPTPEEYKAAVETDPSAAIRYLTTPLLDRVDAILADPIGGVLEILPSAMYFINSNGLETAFTNLVAAVDTVLVGLEPVVGARSLEELLEIDLSEFDAEYILGMLVDMLNESTGMDFSSLAVNLVAELTFGEVVDYVSANGETYYTMNSDGVDNADMVTAVLRMAIDFITTEENLEKIKVLLADVVTDEDAYNSICSILDTLAEYAAEDPGMSKAMSFIYAVFEAATEAIEKTDDAYHDVNNSWQFILKLLSTSEEPLLRDFADNLKGTLNKYFDGIFDEEGLAPDGVMTFWDRLVAFFQRIGEFFRKLFGME